MDPLVVTLALPPEIESRFEAERSRWFPAGRTVVGAHLTLFHAIPGELEDDVRAALGEPQPGFAIRVASVMSLGRGAAYRLESDELDRRHRELQGRWWPQLTRQDQQSLRAHVTVQNKVEPAEARRTVETLQASFAGFGTIATGFRLWRYEGGPWTALAEFRFGD